MCYISRVISKIIQMKVRLMRKHGRYRMYFFFTIYNETADSCCMYRYKNNCNVYTIQNMPLNVVMYLHDISFVYLTFNIYAILMNATHLFTFTSIYLHRNRKQTSEQDSVLRSITNICHTGMIYISRSQCLKTSNCKFE